MSSNRLCYDSCAYQSKMNVSQGPFDYALYSGKYENSAKCRIEFGVNGGNGVSLFSGNLVDLESDLRGQTRRASICPSAKFRPECGNCDNGANGLPCSSEQCKPKLNHQPSCQMQYFPKVSMPSPPQMSNCNYSGMR